MYICIDYKTCEAIRCMHRKPHRKSKWCKIEEFSLCRGCIKIKKCSEKNSEIEYWGKYYRRVKRDED